MIVATKVGATGSLSRGVLPGADPALGPGLEGGCLHREKRERLSGMGCGISKGTSKEEDISECRGRIKACQPNGCSCVRSDVWHCSDHLVIMRLSLRVRDNSLGMFYKVLNILRI